jgi:two-component system response regulator YesN
MKIEAHTSWDEIVGYFQKLADFVFEQKKDDYFKSTNRIIGFIKNYTEEHIDGDISLTKLAELLHFNPSYLSRLYNYG